jgi:hypothetical protein
VSTKECIFLEEVRRMQRRFWLGMLVWLVGTLVTGVVVSEWFPSAPPLIVQAIVYGGFIVMFYMPAFRLHKLRCPLCTDSAGALPFVQYKTLKCRACKRSVECRS